MLNLKLAQTEFSYGSIINKIFIRELMELRVKDIFTGVKPTFDPIVITNNL